MLLLLTLYTADWFVEVVPHDPQRLTQNLVKPCQTLAKIVNGFQLLSTIFAKPSVLKVGKGSDYD